MILESVPWKELLYKDSEFLKKTRLWTFTNAVAKKDESRLAKFERSIFIVAFSIRKLMDSAKLSMECQKYEIPSVRYRLLKGARPDLTNWHNIDKHFDLGKPERYLFSTRKLCNLLIHSFQFLGSFDRKNKLIGFMVSSDQERNKHLYLVQLNDFIELIQYVASDDIEHLHMQRNQDGDWVILEAERNVLEAGLAKRVGS